VATVTKPAYLIGEFANNNIGALQAPQVFAVILANIVSSSSRMVGKTLMEGSQTMARCTNLRFSKIASAGRGMDRRADLFFPIFYMVMTSFKTDATVNLNSCSFTPVGKLRQHDGQLRLLALRDNSDHVGVRDVVRSGGGVPCAYSMAFSPPFNQRHPDGCCPQDASTACLPDDVPDEERSGP
jgi:hypothetical protein